MTKTLFPLLALVLTTHLLLAIDKAFAAPVETSRSSSVSLTSPTSNESFTFLVFADRTTGQDEGLLVLAEAVQDANRLSPDFVMNVGDMVQGYNTTEQWLPQMEAYKAVMGQLKSPWYPTPGNHDVYGGRAAATMPKGQHEKEYEEHFGPLWYAFEHKNHWFVVLFTDEGNPETGQKDFNSLECQKMSEAQFTWLKSVLKKAAGAEGVFVFQHHPRWLGGNYGNDWENRVHTALVEAGNVKAVFAGHIHRMRYDTKDGIDYVVLATTGGSISQPNAEAGLLHEIHHVSVRRGEKLAITAIPVATTIDVYQLTEEYREAALAKTKSEEPSQEKPSTPAKQHPTSSPSALPQGTVL